MDLHNFTPDRLITISFPELAKLDASSDALLALEATGTEAISSPFEYQVKFLSFDVMIADEDFLAEPAVIKISQPHCAPKIVHGIVDRISETRVSASSSFRLFSVRVVPRLALLKESLDYRIYQNQSVLEMIKLIFKFCHAGKLDFSRLTKTYAPIDYCVQYSESYFDFLSRMCEQHKIFYYCETREKPSNNTMTEYEHVICFEDFGQPKETYPDKTIAYNSPHYQDKTMSDCTFTTVAPSQYTIKSNVSDLHVGQTFTLTNHPFDFFKQAYFVTGFQCHAQDYSQQDYFKSTEQQPLNTTFESQFTMLGEKQLPYVVEEKTPKPVGYCETAIVSGYDDDEIYTDELGRVTVSFPWDHHGKKDHTSSCWVPVMKTTSGESHSSNFLPRVGDEVLIHHENGNPDKPIITGCLYNAENLPPFDLEETPYKSGIKTRTLESTDPDEGNWISFDDDPDNPNIEIHAQKDMKAVVKQDYQRDVQADASLTINQGDFKHSTGGELHMNASKEIRFSCGNSAVVLNEEGISFEGNKIEVIKAAVPTPVLPPGDVIANMVKTLDEVSNPPAQPSTTEQDNSLKEAAEKMLPSAEVEVVNYHEDAGPKQCYVNRVLYAATMSITLSAKAKLINKKSVYKDQFQISLFQEECKKKLVDVCSSFTIGAISLMSSVSTVKVKNQYCEYEFELHPKVVSPNKMIFSSELTKNNSINDNEWSLKCDMHIKIVLNLDRVQHELEAQPIHQVIQQEDMRPKFNQSLYELFCSDSCAVVLGAGLASAGVVVLAVALLPLDIAGVLIAGTSMVAFN